MITDIIELHHKLYQYRIDAGLEKEEAAKKERIQARIARAQRLNKDIEILSRSGSSPCQISYVVKARAAAIERDQKEYSDFLVMSRPSQGGSFAILRC